MSIFWTIFWLAINVLLGIFLAIACYKVGEWCKKLNNAVNAWEKTEAGSKIGNWLWVACATIIILISISFGELGFGLSNVIDKLDSRIEALEKQTTFPAIDTLYINNLVNPEQND